VVPAPVLAPDVVVAELGAPVLRFEHVEVGRRRLDDWVPLVLLPRPEVGVVSRRETGELITAVSAGVQKRWGTVVVDRTARPAAVAVGAVRGG